MKAFLVILSLSLVSVGAFAGETKSGNPLYDNSVTCPFAAKGSAMENHGVYNKRIASIENSNTAVVK